LTPPTLGQPMTITDLLRKLGIFRSGTVKWIGDAGNRPYAAISQDVFDEEKDLVHAEDIEQVEKALPGDGRRDPTRTGPLAVIARLALWLIGILFVVSGVLIALSQFWAGFLLACLGILAVPPLYRRLVPWLRLTRARTVALTIVLAFAFLMALGSNPSYEQSADRHKLAVVDAVVTRPAKLDQLAQTMAELAYSYQQARDHMLLAYDINANDMAETEYLDYLRLVSAEWSVVRHHVNALKQLAADAPEKFSATTLMRACSPSIIRCGYALSPRELTEEPMMDTSSGPADVYGVRRGLDAEAESAYLERLHADRERNLRQAELIRRAYPEKGWLTALAEAFDTDARHAETIMYELQHEADVSYREAMSDIDKRQRAKYVAQTGLKVALYTTSIPATGGASAAIGTFLGGVDVALSVGDTVRVFKSDRDGLIHFKDDADLVAPVMALVGAQGLAKNVGNYGRDDLLYLSDRVMSVLKENSNDPYVNMLKVASDGTAQVVYYDVPKTELLDSGQDSGNEYLPPNITAALARAHAPQDRAIADGYAETMKQIRAKLGDEAWQKLMAEAKIRHEKQAEEIAQRELVREAAEKEAARKEAEIKRIIARNEARRELKKIEEEEGVERGQQQPESPQTQAATPNSAVEQGQKVESCQLCWDGGFDCVCWKGCVCCAKGADCSSAVQ